MLGFRVPWLLLMLFGGIGFTERASAQDRQVWFVSGQTIHLTEELVVGLSAQSNGVVLVEGGILRCPDAVIGRERFAANNYVWVGGAGSRWELADSLTIGMEGSTNRAVVRHGGQLEVGDLRLGWGLNTMSADNALLLRDAGTRAVVNRELILGSGGNRVEMA